MLFSAINENVASLHIVFGCGNCVKDIQRQRNIRRCSEQSGCIYFCIFSYICFRIYLYVGGNRSVSISKLSVYSILVSSEFRIPIFILFYFLSTLF